MEKGEARILIPIIVMAEITEGYSGNDIRRISEKAGDLPSVESVKMERKGTWRCATD